MEKNFNNYGNNPEYDESNEDRKNYTYFKKIATSTYDRWHTQSVQNATAPGVITFNTGVIKLMPLVLPKRTSLDRIGCEVTTAGTSGSIGRIGIYDSIDVVPNKLIIDAGTVTTSAITVSSIIIDIKLEAGLYYLALSTNSAANVTFRAIVPGGVPNILGSSSSFGTAVATHLAISFTFGVFPYHILNSNFIKVTTMAPIVSLRYKKQN